MVFAIAGKPDETLIKSEFVTIKLICHFPWRSFRFYWSYTHIIFCKHDVCSLIRSDISSILVKQQRHFLHEKTSEIIVLKITVYLITSDELIIYQIHLFKTNKLLLVYLHMPKIESYRQVQCQYETIFLYIRKSYAVKFSTMSIFENNIIVKMHTLCTKLNKVRCVCVCFQSWKFLF